MLGTEKESDESERVVAGIRGMSDSATTCIRILNYPETAGLSIFLFVFMLYLHRLDPHLLPYPRTPTPRARSIECFSHSPSPCFWCSNHAITLYRSRRRMGLYPIQRSVSWTERKKEGKEKIPIVRSEASLSPFS